MVDVELLGDAPGVVDVGHAAAAGVALTAPEPHRDARRRRGPRGATAPRQRTSRPRRSSPTMHPSSGAAPPCWRSRSQRPALRRRLAIRSSVRTVRRPHRRRRPARSSFGRGSSAAPRPPTSVRRPSRRGRATGPSPRSRTPTPRTRTRPPGRAGTAATRSRCPRRVRAPSRRPCRRGRRSRADRGRAATSPATSRSRRAAMRTVSVARSASVAASASASRHDPGDVVRAAAPLALLAAADDAAGRPPRPSRTASTPTPFGPPNLWALSDSRSTCGHRSRMSSQHAAWIASVCSSASARARARRRDTAARSVIEPTSLLTAITLTMATSGPSDSASAPRSTRAAASTGTTVPS